MRTTLFALIEPYILAPMQLAQAAGAILAIIIRDRFGTVTLIATNARQMQFALKDVF